MKTVDRTFLMLVGFLILFGIVMVYDATAVFASGTFGEAYRLIILHVGWVAVGLMGFVFFCRYDYKKISAIAYPAFALTVVLLFFLAAVGLAPCSVNIPFAPCINGANRWIYLNPPPAPRIPFVGVLGFQPSELAKLVIILYLAVVVSKNANDKWSPFIAFLFIAGTVSLLVLFQPNMSTAVLIFLIAAAMYFASRATLLPLLVLLPTLLVTGAMFVVSSEYRRARLVTFLNPAASGELTLGYHIKQVLIALGSGGVLGVGFGQSRQKFQYLPEVASDSIFAIIGEELGFLGTFVLLSVFMLLIIKGYTIAKKAPDLLGRLLAVGITTWLGLQFFLNVCAMTKLIPLTGIPIPLVSYGGSSTVFSLMALGVLANISSQES